MEASTSLGRERREVDDLAELLNRRVGVRAVVLRVEPEEALGPIATILRGHVEQDATVGRHGRDELVVDARGERLVLLRAPGLKNQRAVKFTVFC